MFTTKAKLTTSLTLLVALVAGAGLLAYRTSAAEQPTAAPQKKADAPPAARPAGPTPTDAPGDLEIKGRVLDPDGKPVAGATLRVPAFEKLTAKTGDDGAFHFKLSMKEVLKDAPDGTLWTWTQVIAQKDGHGIAFKAVRERDRDGNLDLKLPKDDVPVEGRILDLEGRPVAGATVRVVRLSDPLSGNLDLFLKAWPDGPGEAIAGGGQVMAAVKVGEKPQVQQAPEWRRLWQPGKAGLFPTLTTDRDGKFKLAGVGRERFVEIEVVGPTVAREELRVITRKGVDLKALGKPNPDLARRFGGVLPFGMMPSLYGPSFEHLMEPTKPVHGCVKDRASGKPIAGVRIIGVNGNRKFSTYNVEAVTDDRGEYQLVGLSKAKAYTITADPKEGRVYLPDQKALDDTEGLKPLRADLELTRGIVVEGRLIDRATGKPVRGNVRYVPLPGNDHVTAPNSLVESLLNASLWVKPDGQFRAVIYPGPGALYATSDAGEYLPALVTEEDRKKGFETGLSASGQGRRIIEANTYKVVEPDAKAGTLKVDLEFLAGGKLTGELEGPDGKPVPGVWAMPATSEILNAYSSAALRPQVDGKGGTYTVTGIDPRRSDGLAFFHIERKLAAHVSLRGDEKEGPAVRLQPWAKVRGRVLDADGKPLAGIDVRLEYRDGAGKPVNLDRFGRTLLSRLRTDAEGKFTCDGVVPGLKCKVILLTRTQPSAEPTQVEFTSDGITFKPNEGRDLGDVKLMKK